MSVKISFFATALLSLLLLTATAGKVEHVYHFASPVVRQYGDYQLLQLSNSFTTALPGNPALPYCQVKLVLPQGESATGYEIIFSDEVILPGKFNLIPQQESSPISVSSSGILKKDAAVYSRNAFLPDNPKGKLITSFFRGRSVALTSFTPVRYNPVTCQLSYYATANVVMQSAPDAKAVQALHNLVAMDDETALLPDNKDMARTYKLKPLAPTVPYDLLIVCTSEFKNSFINLQANYLKEGLTSLVAPLDSITSVATGADVQEKIRNFIIDMYQHHATQYVMLAGDDELIPHRGFYCYVQSGSGYSDQNIPSDLYYSALDGNWNDNGNALWGEPGEEDLLPDIAVGRMPFSTAAELEHMLNKSFKYQFEPVAGEFRNVLMAGEWLYDNPISYGSDYLTMLKGEHSDNGYTTNGIPADYTFDELYDKNATWSKIDLLNHLNQGRPMLNHLGHANTTYVMRLSNSDITNTNFAGLNGVDHNYTIVYTEGCDCGAFDFNICIAKTMVTIDNFAAAFIGNSRYGWFNEGQTEGPSLHLHREFMDALYNDSLNRIGRAHMESKIASAAWVTAPGQWEPGALRWCFYDCNVLGDPALAIFTDNPIPIITSVDTVFPVESASIPVSVTSSGLPAKGLTCVVIKDGSMLGKSITDGDGKATVEFKTQSILPGNAQLFVSGYNCLPTGYDFKFVDYTGKKEIASDISKMNISPNPARQKITIDAYAKQVCSFILVVYNSQGKVVVPGKKNVSDSNGRIREDIDISTLKPGFYTCRVISDKTSISRPFVVN